MTEQLNKLYAECTHHLFELQDTQQRVRELVAESKKHEKRQQELQVAIVDLRQQIEVLETAQEKSTAVVAADDMRRKTIVKQLRAATTLTIQSVVLICLSYQLIAGLEPDQIANLSRSGPKPINTQQVESALVRLQSKGKVKPLGNGRWVRCG